MKLSVDPERCYGSGDCAYRVPSVFMLVDGYGAIVPGRDDGGGEPEVHKAVEGCPSQAITVTEQRLGPPAG